MAKRNVQPPKKRQRKRNRVPISCTICRRRKVKCDKKKPQCANCVKNGVAHLCRYLEPSWAKPLCDDELKIPGTNVSNYNDQLQHENSRMKRRIQDLEQQNSELKHNQSHGGVVDRVAAMRGSDNTDLLDCIANSSILFTAKRGPVYHFPIIYQISVLSWMFIVRNDSYLNDLWLKIIKLRRHYEYYYSSKNAMMDASKTLAKDYNNYGSKLDKIRDRASVGVIPPEKTVEHTSKLKKFLDGTLSKSATGVSSSLDDAPPGTSRSGCPVVRDGSYRNLTQNRMMTNKCPVMHPGNASVSYSDVPEDDEDEVDDMEDSKVCPLMIGDARALFKEKLSRMNLSAMRETVKPRDNEAPLAKTPENETKDGTVTPPTSHGSPVEAAKTDSSISTVSTTSGKKRSCPESRTSCSSSHRNKRIQTISPSAVKSLNYNNTKEVITVIEKNLPSRKVVWLLIDRFFEKLYLHFPYIDEETFRIRIASIIDTTEAGSEKIKLQSIGSQYCEEFLNVCLMLVIIRLSWLSLPDKVSNDLTAEEVLMMKPENLVTMVLIDMVKEIFSSAKIMGKPSLIIFQVGLFLKIYNILSPEDGFDLDDSFTNNNNSSLLVSNDLSGDLTNEAPDMNSPNFMAMLVQLARTIGLNRDPLNFKNFYSSSSDPITNARLFRKRHLWRKLWYGLMYLSIESNLSMGDYKKGLPIELDLDPTLGSVNKTWDCRLPGGVEQGVLEKSFYGPALEKEQIVVSNFRDSIVVYHSLYKAMNALFLTDSPPTTKSMGQIMNRLLDLISEKSKLGLNTSFLLSPGDNTTAASASNMNARSRTSLNDTRYGKYVRIYKLRLYLVIKSLLFALNYLLLLNHEQKFNRLIADKSSTIPKITRQKEYIDTYFEGSLLLAIDNFNFFIQLIDNLSKLFPNCGAKLITFPFLLVLNHRSHEFLISLILRLQQGSPIIVEILEKNGIDRDKLLKRLFHYLSTFLDKLDGLTKSYYYAWRLRKMVKFFYSILTNSKKLFSMDFKQMNAGIKEEPQEDPSIPPTSFIGGRRVVPLRPKQPLVYLEQQQQKQQPRLQKQPQQIHQLPLSGPASAFEIAFGTSKLPPVTDYTDLNNAAYEYYQQDAIHAATSPMAPGSFRSQPFALPSRGPPQQISFVSQKGLGNMREVKGGMIGNQYAGQIDDFLDENFFTDLTELNMGSLANDSMDGMACPPGMLSSALSGEMGVVGSESSTINMRNGEFAIDGGAGGAGGDVGGVGGGMSPGLGPEIGAGIIVSAQNAMFGGNGFVGSAYNSLNEIDFTNVDLSSQFGDNNSNYSQAGINGAGGADGADLDERFGATGMEAISTETTGTTGVMGTSSSRAANISPESHHLGLEGLNLRFTE
ncbi:hypothetical protein FOA43_001777 [Brettanomyces nanus]|uniref:Zn(2)-C6 fungal-type domain-containing protein n=1 Tax=Eeniella nana TaxID=13502 RepID=A0A875S0G2_EENNA|nr:uncharacterized protein FOA43_001777 [Brettanomyces nanus]QPG74448.1 hypothetical protein FOA43_001777 [Brettanomyces nanus]